jgi:SHAQKYF class myb-like DNA-binding protein
MAKPASTPVLVQQPIAAAPVPTTTTQVPTPVPVAPAPEATAAALAAAAAAVGVPQPEISPVPVEANSSSDTGASTIATAAAAAAAAAAVASAGSPVGKAAPKGPSKKKKSQVTVTMATAAAAAAAQLGGQGAQGENTGRWTAEEHRLFLQGLELHGKGWKKIAGLIKSRTVVQIRTHAQKYFQKLAKAKQNGEEGDILMEGRGGTASIPSVTTSAAQTNKRRKQTSGTKRKAIQSVVASAQREAKKLATAGDDAAGIMSVAPALSPYILPPVANPMDPSPVFGSGQSTVPSVTTEHGTISGSALEDSLYVDSFLRTSQVSLFSFAKQPHTDFFSFANTYCSDSVTLHQSLWHHCRNSK